MRFYYEEKTPLRILDEIEFWKRQETEHTVVIRQVVNDLEPRFVEKLEEWAAIFGRTEAAAVRCIEAVIRSGPRLGPEFMVQVEDLAEIALDESRKFVAFLGEISAASEAVQNNPVALVVINHITRESEYFRGILEAFLYGYCLADRRTVGV